MKKLYVLTTLLFLSCIGFAQADLVITEISYNGPESVTDSTEFVEIYNNGTNAINLNNYYFSSGIIYTFPNISINAGAYVVIAFDSVALMNVFGVNAYQWTTGGLSNGGEPLAIRDNNGLLVDTLRYDDVSPWPTDPDGNGSTLVLCDPSSDNTDGSNWTSSTTLITGLIVNAKQVSGSPGAIDAGCSTVLMASITNDSDVTCNGLANGGATASATSGTAPYTFEWSNSATTASITGVVADTYTVTITDANSDTSSASIIITEPSLLVSTASVSSPISLQGATDGAVLASATGGTNPYTYAWNNGGTGAAETNLGSGTYSVTLTDQNGCTDSTSVTLGDPMALSASKIDITGTNNGSIDVTVLGGSTPYTYLWSNGITTQDLTNLTTSGAYTLTVTDNNNDTASLTVEIISTLDYFVSTWKTDNTGNSNSTSITIPTNSGFTYNYDIDWNNDGVFDTLGVTGNITHDYTTAGTYTVKIKGTFPNLYFPSSSGDNNKLVSIDQWGTQQWESMKQMFFKCENFEILAIDTPDLSMVTDMTYMFGRAENFNNDISHWDVSSVEIMIGVFSSASSFNQPLNTWDVSAVTNMENLFNNATVFNQSLSTWQTDSVDQMSGVFYNAEAFNQDISSWEVGNVTEMEDMFSGAESFNQPLNTWDVSKVTEMHAIFRDAVVFNQDLNNWDVSSVVETSAAFDGAIAFNGDISSWNVGNVEYMQEMFEGATVFNQDISGWDVSSATTMTYMFMNADSFNQDIGNWNVTAMEKMGDMFREAISFNQDIGNWDVSSVTTMSRMFSGATSFDQNLGNWDVSEVTDFGSMFENGHLSTPNYDSLLLGWSALTLQATQTFHAGSSNYCEGDTARQNIITNFGWSISDSGQLCDPVINLISTNVNCFGNSDGSLAATVNYGTAPLTYAWSNGSSDSAIINLAPGTYTLTVTDSTGVADTSSATISEPLQFIAIAVVDSNVSCSGTPEGGASVSLSGGTLPYTYLWSNNDTTASITGVIENTYYVTTTDLNGCTNMDTLNVVVADTMLPMVITQNITSYVDVNGNATITAAEVDNGSSDACGIQTMQLDMTSFTCSNLGANTVELVVTDVNGNSDSATAIVMVMDTINPIAIGQAVTTYLNAQGQTTITVADVNNNSSDNCSINTMVLSNTSFSCADISGASTELIITDVSGNSDTAVVNVTVMDTVSPNILTQNVTVYLDASGSVSITAADIDNGSTDNCAIQTISLNSTQFDCTETGYNAVVLSVEDVNGNISTKTATVTVLDTISPTVIAQNHTAYLNPSGFALINVSDINNGSTDNCSIQSYTLSQNIFNCADTGLNVVSLEVTDVNGNISSANVTVTIMDTLMPIMSTQNMTVYLDASGQASITENDIDNGSTDNCSIQNMTLDISNFDCNDVGSNAVTLTVTDVNGNVNTSTATVTVMDTILPTVVTQDITVYLDATGMITVANTDIDNGSADNCTIQSSSLDISSFNCNDLGTNTVILAVTDANGNVNSASAVVTVLDTIIPVITCPASFSDCGPEITIPDVITTDNCVTTLTLVSGIESNQTFPVGVTTNTYTVEDESGNSATCSLDITRFPQPIVSVREDTTVYFEQSVVLNSNSEFVVEWEWTPGTYLDDASLQQPLCTPEYTTDYTLVGRSADGCYSDPKTMTVTVYSDGEVLVPNTFSPNADGYNDYFEIPGISFHPDMRMTIFNRNGEILFQETGYENNWDGTANGKQLPVATYYFILDQGDGKEPIKGDITIIK